MSTKQDRLLSTIHKFVSIFMKSDWFNVPTGLLKEKKNSTQTKQVTNMILDATIRTSSKQNRVIFIHKKRSSHHFFLFP